MHTDRWLDWVNLVGTGLQMLLQGAWMHCKLDNLCVDDWECIVLNIFQQINHSLCKFCLYG